jgi:hypothetical protein
MDILAKIRPRIGVQESRPLSIAETGLGLLWEHRESERQNRVKFRSGDKVGQSQLAFIRFQLFPLSFLPLHLGFGLSPFYFSNGIEIRRKIKDMTYSHFLKCDPKPRELDFYLLQIIIIQDKYKLNISCKSTLHKLQPIRVLVYYCERDEVDGW